MVVPPVTADREAAIRDGERLDEWPEGFYWSEAEGRPVYSPQRDDASGEARQSGSVVAAESDATGVPHLDRASELLWQHHHPQIAVALEAEVSGLLAELAAVRERERAQHEALLAQAREIRAARDQIENEIPWTKDGAYEALREREEKLREALREIVRYFDSYGLPPAGLPLGLARAALSEGEG